MLVTSKLRVVFSNITGYFIYRKAHLPVGVDLEEDLINKFEVHPKQIFDVGANYGQTAIHYHKLFNDASIYSFEPIKNSFLKLLDKTKHISKIKCFNIALGNEKGELEVFLHNEYNSQLNSLKVNNDLKADKSIKETIQVDTIDNFVFERKINQIDLLKIDTEGFELEVLMGANTLLKNGKIKAILCEVALSKKNKRNTQLDDVIDLLDSLDYFLVGFYDTNVNYYDQGIAYSNALFIAKKQ